MNSLPQTRHRAVPESLRALLEDLIDYAGLFPPAALDMASAVRNYSRYLDSEFSWMLGRFVVPANRLSEFEQARTSLAASRQWNANLGTIPLPEGEGPEGLGTIPLPVGQGATEVMRDLRLTALLGSDAAADIEHVAEFNLGNAERARVDAIEAKASTAADITLVDALLPAETIAYFEIAPDNASDLVPAIRDIGGRAKIRTGGVTPDAIPSPDSVALFIRECARHNVPFKATAGLHHPLRAIRSLTTDVDSPRAAMHGFMNVFLTSVLAYKQPDFSPATMAMLLSSSSPTLHFTDEAVDISTSETRITLSAADIRRARREFAISFGSCSFDEPISDLHDLNLL